MSEASALPDAPDPGDLGRRVRARRLALGWSVADLAERAGMAPGYVQFLEERPSAAPTAATLARLAGAMETTVTALRGAGQERPPGSGGATARHPVLEVLDAPTCRQLLAGGGVGRVVFDGPRGAVAVPVNFVLDGDALELRTGEGDIAAAARLGGRLGFEVDRLDEALGEGWSVLVIGRADVLPAAAGGEASHQSPPAAPEPWSGGERAVAVRISLDELTGRRIRHQS